MLITHTHLITPGLEIPDAYILIENDRIKSCGPSNQAPSAQTHETLDAQGTYTLPGFIDIHAHGADGRDVCDNSADSLQHIAQKKIAEGVTTWLPTTLTQPKEKLADIVRTCSAWAPTAPLHIPGLHIEGPFINRDKAGAQNPEFVREPDEAELRELHHIFPALILSLAPEMPGASSLIETCRELGITPSAAHTAADSATIQNAITHGLKHLTHFGNAMTGLHHREIGAVGAGLIEESLQLELIADGIHLSPGMLKLIFEKVSTHRLLVITDSTAASWIGEGELQLGGLDVIVKDNQARLKDGGALAGSTLKFNDALPILLQATGLTLPEIIRTTSLNQALTLGLDHLGEIKPGYLANLAILDKDFQVQHTLINGQLA